MAGENPERVRGLLRFDLQLRRAAAAGLPFNEGSASRTSSSEAVDRDREPRLRLAGFDEAGRGSLAGPVTVACVAFDLPCDLEADGDRTDTLCRSLPYLDDSKRVTPRRRLVLNEAILSLARCGVGHASAVEIDRIGIVAACSAAAGRALEDLGGPLDVALLDRGLALPGSAHSVLPTGFREVSLTRGDARSFHIAAASIVAKVSRDVLMERLDSRFPGYGLARHKGYGTAVHRAALVERGPSPIHRATFLHEAGGAKSQFC
jgi:ribonuclease HII